MWHSLSITASRSKFNSQYRQLRLLASQAECTADLNMQIQLWSRCFYSTISEIVIIRMWHRSPRWRRWRRRNWRGSHALPLANFELPFFEDLQTQMMPLRFFPSASIVSCGRCIAVPNLSISSIACLSITDCPRERAEHSYFFGEIKLISHGDPEKARLLVFASQPGKSGEEDARTGITPGDNARRMNVEPRP